jgi:hypothetical protein
MIFRDEEDYENHSQKLRADLGVSDRFCADMIYCAKRLKEIGRIADFKIVPDDLMPRDNAKYDGIDRTLIVPRRTFYALDKIGNVSKAERRHQRFTLAHEFAHVVQEVPGSRFRGLSGALGQRVDPTIRIDEIQANKFAAAFLIPSDLADPTKSADVLSELFDVNLRPTNIRRNQILRLRRRATGQPRALPRSIFSLLRDAKKQGFISKSLEIEIERQRAEAKAAGYEDIECAACGNFTLRQREGLIKCETCGSEVRDSK